MMKLVLLNARALLSGGAGYVILIVGVILAFQNWQNARLKDERDQLKSARDQARLEVQERNALLDSQTRQFNRQIAQRKEQNHAEKFIQSVPDGNACMDSAPIGRALEWLRNQQGDATPNDND